MRQASKRIPESAEKTVRDIRRATRRHHSAEEKIRIVLEGLRGEDSVAELCRKEGINQNLDQPPLSGPGGRQSDKPSKQLGLIARLQHAEQFKQDTGRGAAPGPDGLDRRRGAPCPYHKPKTADRDRESAGCSWRDRCEAGLSERLQ